jgi:hypothetical protein
LVVTALATGKAARMAKSVLEATIKAIIDSIDRLKYQVYFGLNQTASIREWQIVKSSQVRWGDTRINSLAGGFYIFLRVSAII